MDDTTTTLLKPTARKGGRRLIEEIRNLSFMGMRVHFQLVRPEESIENRVLLLSSPWMNTFHWRKILPEMDGLNCLTVAVDLPGFGQSQCDLPWDDELTSNLLWGVLDTVDAITETPMSLWHLVAHGCACRTILRMARNCPDSVKSQVHISPTLSLRTTGPRRVNPERWYEANVLNPQRFRHMIAHYAACPMEDFIVDRMRRAFLGQDQRDTLIHYLQRCGTPPQEGSGFCPTMVIYGGRDPFLDEVRTQQMHQLLHGAEYHRLSNAGHFPTETHSRAVRDYLRGWLKYNA